MRTTTGATPPYALIYRNGTILYLPTYDQSFVQRLKRLIPPHVRCFHQVPVARYVIVSPWDKKAIALAGEFWAEFSRVYTDQPYEFPGDDAHLVLQRRGGGR